MRAIVVAVAVLVGWTGSALAQDQDTLSLSTLSLNLAIDKVKKAGDECKQAALTPLKDARDALQGERAKPTVEGLTKVRRTVEDLADGLGDKCGAPVASELTRALERLQKAIDERAPAAAAANAPKAAGSSAAASEEAKRCWNYKNPWTPVDPGCAHTKNGQPPLDRAAFDKLAGPVRATRDRFEQTGHLEKAFGMQKLYVTCLQVYTIINALGEEVDRLETVKRAASTLVDPHNAATIGRAFSDPNMRRDAVQSVDELKAN